MTPTILETLKQALEIVGWETDAYAQQVSTNLRAAIKQMEKVEPVATYAGSRDLPSGTTEFWGYLWNQDVQLEKGQKLFTYPIEDWMLKPMLAVDHTAPAVPDHPHDNPAVYSDKDCVLHWKDEATKRPCALLHFHSAPAAPEFTCPYCKHEQPYAEISCHNCNAKYTIDAPKP